MRIVYFRLRGYAGIKHGMGKDEIVIPFMNFHTPMILIRGDNGCGKSTILKALSLDIDSSDNYINDVYWNPINGDKVDEIAHPAEKEIHLMSGQDIYKVLIQSPVKNGKRLTTKAYISLNGEELNPNGNVSSYKEIRNSLFDMDPNYINLSIVTSENRGLVDKKPAERKKYMSEIIGTLEFFNNLYRTLSKKSSTYRSSINQIKAKIYNIGDPDNLEMSLKSSLARIDYLERSKEELSKEMAEMNATIKILDPDGKIQDLYSSIVDELGTINSEIEQYTKMTDKLHRESGIFPENEDMHAEKKRLENLMSKYDGDLRVIQNDVNTSIAKLDRDQAKLEELNGKLSSWTSDNIRSDIETVVDDIKTKISLYEATFKGTDADLSLSESELLTIKDALVDIKHNVNQIYDRDNEIISDILNELLTEKASFKYMGRHSRKKTELEKLERRKAELEASISASSVLKDRPSNCTINDCPFIAHVVTFDIAEMMLDLDETTISIEELKPEVDDLFTMSIEENIIYTHIDAICRIIHNTKRLLERVPSIHNCIIDRRTIINNILNHYQFNEFLEIDELLTMADLVEDYRKQKELLVGYEADLKIYRNNQSMIQSINQEIQSVQEEINTDKSRIDSLSADSKKYSALINDLLQKILKIDEIIHYEELLSNVTEKKKQLSEKFHKAKDDIAKVQDYVAKIKYVEDSINTIMMEYVPLRDGIEKMKFSISQLNSYRADLNRMESNFEKAEFLKKACNPSTGIQSIYISIYMEKTIVIANDILSYFFGGEVKLMKPVINQDSFELPFVNGSGSAIPDISMGSTSQKCMTGMALSFALLNQGSEKYNIFRMDEIDGGLDFNNSEQFTRMILPIMQLLDIEQAIMISHKMEIDTLNTTVLDVTANGIFINGKKVS